MVEFPSDQWYWSISLHSSSQLSLVADTQIKASNLEGGSHHNELHNFFTHSPKEDMGVF